MRHTFAPLFILIAVALLLAAWSSPVHAQKKKKGATYTDPETAAKEDPDFLIQGEYVGAIGDRKVGVQVIALGGGKFQAAIHTGGLPGDGWNKKDKEKKDGDADAIKKLIAGLKRVERKSPTLGAKPPEGAVVLFDGTKETFKANWQNKNDNKITEDGLMVQGNLSTKKFQAFTIHIEFRTPYKPSARGQGRGNSGIYVQGRYEVQMLDSFGLKGNHNECGGIYSVGPPDQNMCYPPLSWQTYDITLTPAQFDDKGKKTRDARMTVLHNGVKVHDNVKVDHSTTASKLKEGPDPGPVYLQDHGNPVRYRNIWVLPKK